MKQVYLGVDLGTSAVKCLAMDIQGQCLSQGEGRYPLYAPHPGWVEQNPEDWMEPVYGAIRDCIKGLNDDCKIASLSYSGHMSSLVLLGNDMKPLLPCSLVGDSRATPQAEELRNLCGNIFAEVTGNIPLQAWVVSKLLWVLQERPDIYERTAKFVMAKDYVRFRMTGELYTDYTDAGNSLLYHPVKKAWNDELIERSGLDKSIFPTLLPATAPAGKITAETAKITGLPEGLPVICGAADMACSQLGTGGMMQGRLIITLSTSGQMCMCVSKPDPSVNDKISFHPGIDSMYAMASVFSGGLAINWGFCLLSGQNPGDVPDFRALDILAADVENYSPGQSGITFLPFLTGSGSPHNCQQDRAHLTGLTLSSDKKDIVHAIMEGVAYNLRENADVFRKLGGWSGVRLGGGGTKMKVWRRIIADVMGEDIDILRTGNASAMGACVLAAAGIGNVESILDLSEKISVCGDKIEYDRQKKAEYDKLFDRYCRTYNALTEIG